MLVQQILKSKGVAEVLTMTPDASVSDAAKQLSSRRIGTVVVSRDGKQPDGIVSERDIVREIGRRGPGCLSDRLDAIMTANPVTCTVHDAADQVLAKMTEGRFRHMPVVEGAEMVGMISLGDVVKARLSEVSMEKDALEGMIMGY